MLAAALSACVAPESDSVVVTDAELSDGYRDAFGVLAFLNDPATDFQILDIDAALDRRAAQNLIDHRNGPDGQFGTGDDDLFDSVAEVDAIRQVGPATLKRLLEFALANGYVGDDDDLLGTFDGVPFTVAEAEAALAFVNYESEQVLDDEVGLDPRAVASILDARPVATMSQLASLYYVGTVGLERIQSHSTPLEIGIISDLDKTIIPPSSSGTLPAAAYAGAAALYGELDVGDGGEPGDVYYVTARSEDMIADVPDWLSDQGLPSGPIDPGVSGLPWIARPEKVADMSKIFDANPRQRFILLGDTNHVDPEVMHDMMEKYPGRIVATYIHGVKNIDPTRTEGLFVYDDFSQVAANLFGIGVLSEAAARSAIDSAVTEGVDLSPADVDALIDQYK